MKRNISIVCPTQVLALVRNTFHVSYQDLIIW